MIAVVANGAAVVGSRHELSAVSTPEICAFCHALPFSNPDLRPLRIEQ